MSLSHWTNFKRCPECNTVMRSDGQSWYCSGCGLTIDKPPKRERKPKKMSKRTAHDVRESSNGE